MSVAGIHATQVGNPFKAQELKLQKAAAEFEAQLLSTLWKSMKNSFAEDADSSDPASQSLQEWGIDAISGAISRAGGMGIAKLIIKDLAEKLTHSEDKRIEHPKL